MTLSSTREPDPKCIKFLHALKGKAVDVYVTGSRENNALDRFLRCECKMKNVCSGQLSKYVACHSSVMGVGSFCGRKNCGNELTDLQACVSLSEISEKKDVGNNEYVT